MTKKNRLLSAIGIITTVSLTTVAAVSCGIAPSEYIGNVKLVNDGKEIVPVEKRTTVLVTDAGKITDKSFNQSAYEGAYLSAKQHGLASRTYISSLEPSTLSDITNQYQVAQANKFENWVLPGYNHGDKIKEYWNQNKAELDKSKVVVIGTDFTPEVTAGHGIGISFDVKDSAYVVGYAAADYLAQKYPSSSATDVQKRSVYAFGGGAFDGVTSFIRGFFHGIQAYNKANPTKKTKIITGSDGSVDLASGFNINTTMDASVNKAVTSNATILLPVAGPATMQVLDKVKQGGAASTGKLIIGVDVDQAIIRPQDKKWFFSSILKRVSQANYDVINELYGKPDDYKLLKGFELGKKSINIVGNFDNNLIGYADSYLDKDDKEKVEKALKDGKANFDSIKSNLATVMDDAGYKDADAKKTLASYLGKLAKTANEATSS